MNLLERFTIGQKLIGSFVIILLVLGLLSTLSTNSLSRMNADMRTIVDINHPASVSALEFANALQDANRSLGFYLITKDHADQQAYMAAMQHLDEKLRELAGEPVISGNRKLQERLDTIRSQVENLGRIQEKLVRTAANPDTNMPAMKYAADHINGEYRNRLQLLTSMLSSEQEEDASAERKALYATLVKARYYWVSINNELRLFLAFRAQSAVDNAHSYRDAIANTLAELDGMSNLFTFEQEEAIAEFKEGMDGFWKDIDIVFRLHTTDKWRMDAYLLKTRAEPALKAVESELAALVKLLEDNSHQAAEAAHTRYNSQLIQAIVSGIAAFVVLGMIAWALSRNISRPIRQAAGFAKEIARGRLDNDIASDSRDETGELLRTLDNMQADLRQRIEADARTAAENLRIRQALDSVSVSVTVSDEENALIYMNRAADSLFRGLETDIRSRHRDFRVDSLLGSKLSTYLDDPELRAAYKRKLEKAETYDTAIAERRLQLIASPVYDDHNTYQGRVTQWTDRTDELRAAEEERARIAAEREVAAENARIRSALDNVSSNVMLADVGRNIIYMNKSAQRLFHESADELRKDLPGFDPNMLIGNSIDSFHANPGHQARLLEGLKDTWEAEIEVGDMTLRIIANPVLGEDGERLGTAVEWADRTSEVAIENEIDSLVESAGRGDLSRRIGLEGKEGFFRKLGEGFNQLLDQLSNVFDDIGRVMGNLADGRLNHKIEKDYSGTFGKVTDDINRTIDNLSRVISDLREAATSVATNSTEIATGNNNLSARTEQQASSLQETASSMEELTSTVKNNADNAQQANQLAGSARQSAEKGGAVVSDAVVAMQEIDVASNQIAEIIGVIDEIAFQTNLLALNASVEAARAGEQGRGFAVVASEVRNLASRSADAAKKIKDLINDSLSKVSAGTALVNASGQTLEEIVQGVKKVGDIVAEIAAASSEQSDGIAQVNQAVTAMDELTQQNAALAEQTSAASATMSEKASEMQDLVGFFDTGEKTQGRLESGARSASTTAFPASAPVAPAPKPVAKVQKLASPPATSANEEDEGEWEEF